MSAADMSQRQYDWRVGPYKVHKIMGPVQAPTNQVPCPLGVPELLTVAHMKEENSIPRW